MGMVDPTVTTDEPGAVAPARLSSSIEDLRARAVLLADDELLVRVYRSLFFAWIALAGRDVAFGFARLAEAALCSPRWTVRIAARRLARRRRHERQVADEAWTAPAESVA